MKRLLALACAAACAASCSQQASSSTANLRGAHDLVLIDKLLFTTSTDRDELRVLDLFPPDLLVGSRRYLRAPNPLEALSIPVLSRPSALARDLHFEDTMDAMGMVTIVNGTEVGGPWVYAMRAGGSEISIVGGGPESDPAQLSEVTRIQTAGIVTAAAGLGKATSTASRLFFTTWNGEASTIQSIDVPATVKALKAAGTLPQKVLGAIPGEVIVDLVIVPPIAMRGLCETNDCLVLATRFDQGRQGRALLFDPVSRASRELHFPGPVRQLAIHAGTRNEAEYIAAGQRVFAVLDEEQGKCTGFDDCGGVIAVDTTTGNVALDASGQPMLPIRTGIALPTGLAVAARGQLLLPFLDNGVVAAAVQTLPALGIITTSNGAVVFFDAVQLTHFDTNLSSSGAAPLNVGLYTPEGILAQIGAYETDGSKGGPVFDKNGNGITLANGAWKSEVIDVVVNGFLPGLEDQAVPVVDGGVATSFPVAPEALARTRVGDTLVFRASNDTLCSTPITDIGSGAISSNLLTPDGGTCPDRKRFAVRAAGDDKFVVKGSLSGYLGRAGPGKAFRYFGSYFQRILPFDPTAPTFTMTLGPDNAALTPDWRWSIDVQPNIDNFALTISPSAIGCSTNVAGSVVFDFARNRVFFALPSANAIVDLAPDTAGPGAQQLDLNATCYP